MFELSKLIVKSPLLAVVVKNIRAKKLLCIYFVDSGELLNPNGLGLTLGFRFPMMFQSSRW